MSARTRMLVAGVDADSGRRLAEVLRREFDCDVDVARNGTDALRLAQAEAPDVVVLDLRMPGLGGLKVARRMRSQWLDGAHGPGTPPLLIALTGDGGADTIDAARGCFDHVFRKPLDMPDLARVVRQRRTGVRPDATVGIVDFAGLAHRLVGAVRTAGAGAVTRLGFDTDLSPVWIEDDALRVEAGLRRLLGAADETLGHGGTAERARVEQRPDGTVQLVVPIPDTGGIGAAQVQALAGRLGLTEQAGATAAEGAGFRAAGLCPLSSGRVTLTSAGPAGIRLRYVPERLRVLVVDPSALNRVIAVAMLAALGCRADGVADGRDAVARCRGWHPDLVLLALDGPACSGGLATARQLRRLQSLGSLPGFDIVAAAADLSEATRWRSGLAGLDALLERPLQADALRGVLQRAALNELAADELPPAGRLQPLT